MKRQNSIRPKSDAGTFYVWVGGSCDYGHEERCSGGAYLMTKGGEFIEKYVITEAHTTEFRMILTVMIHAMEKIPSGSTIIFMTNVMYIQQNFDKSPTEKSANADLIGRCIEVKSQHLSVNVKIVPYHKYQMLPETHKLAHEAMLQFRGR